MAVLPLPFNGRDYILNFLRSSTQLGLTYLIGVHPEPLHEDIVVRHPE